MAHSKVIIIDYGSQVTQLIARRVREAGVYSEIHACNVTAEEVRAMQPSAVILSGGPASVGEHDAPTPRQGLSRPRRAPCSASATACSCWPRISAARWPSPRPANMAPRI